VGDLDGRRLAYARDHCKLSPLGQSIGEAFLQAYLHGPLHPEETYLRAFERLLYAPEDSEEARAARREMRGAFFESGRRRPRLDIEDALKHRDLMV
jgi:hypothetical protein